MESKQNTHGNVHKHQNPNQWKWISNKQREWDDINNQNLKVYLNDKHWYLNDKLVLNMTDYLMNIFQYINWYLLIYYQMIYFNTLMVFVAGLIYYFMKTLKYVQWYLVLVVKNIGMCLKVFGNWIDATQ